MGGKGMGARISSSELKVSSSHASSASSGSMSIWFEPSEAIARPTSSRYKPSDGFRDADGAGLVGERRGERAFFEGGRALETARASS